MLLFSSREVGFLKRVCLLSAILFFLTFQGYADIPPFNLAFSGLSDSKSTFQLLSDKPLGDFTSLTIPLKRTGNLFLIEARIDDQVGNLIFDTGSLGLVLNRTYFRKYAGIEKPAGSGITGSFDKMLCIMVKQIEIMGLQYKDVAADVTDLGHIENKRGIKVLGLFGLNMMDNFEVIFDAGKSELQLNRIDKNGNRLDAMLPFIKFENTQKIETQQGILLLNGKIGEKTLRFCLDSGAETNVISNTVPKKVMNTIQINRRSGMSGASARSVDVLYGTMKEFEFGNRQFGQMETVVTSLNGLCEAYGCNIDGMLGYEFLQKGVFCFNFIKNEISFTLSKGGEK